MEAQTYIAFLRGLNVGGHNRLSMKDLVAVFEAAGARRVSTYIQSGNVVFDASASVAATLPRLVSAALEKRYQVRSPVVLRTAKELAVAVKNNPLLPAHDAALQHVAFLAAIMIFVTSGGWALGMIVRWWVPGTGLVRLASECMLWLIVVALLASPLARGSLRNRLIAAIPR